MTKTKPNWIMENIFRVPSLIMALIAAVGGYALNDFLDIRAQNRTVLNEEINDFRDKRNNAQVIFSNFSGIASGEKPLQPTDMIEFRTALLNLQNEAKDIENRIPEIKPQYRNLEQSILNLLDKTESLSSADKNQTFVFALGQLLASINEFEKKAIDNQQSFKWRG